MHISPILTISFVLLLLVNRIKAQPNSEMDVYQTFDSIIGYSNSGIFFGKPNTPYPDITPKNHPFFENLNYKNAHLLYKGKIYRDVQLKYDIFNERLQLLPKEKNLLSITLFNDFVDSFSIGEHLFKKYTNIDNQRIFYEVLLTNPYFTLLKSYSKKAKELQIERNSIYTKYQLKTSLFILTNNKSQELKSKKQLLDLFPENKTELNQLYYIRKKDKTKKEVLEDVLRNWNAIILKKEP